VITITDKATTVLFTDNMFRKIPNDIEKSCFYNQPFTLVVLPYDKLDRNRYKGHLRQLPNGQTSNMIVAMDMDRLLGVIIGSAYGGSVKKLIFTVMNYLLPLEKILPIHCSANEGDNKDSALLLGLSGTGKTSLSADPSRALLGDDEHGWSDNGIANFENGCYAKFININPEKESEIYNAVMHEDDYLQHGAIVENAMIYPNGRFDFNDDRFTPNSRASYPLQYLSNIKSDSKAGHPKTILFLTADANGVIPPVSKLTPDQAMLWFLMGYTSKLAGTETGIVEPVSTFSRFFGEPFMPLNPDIYASMLGEKMKKHGSQVYLIN
ncbi:MAG: phosphoenolpyruvate carboxykinase (ATP), partial [bacterium]